MIVLVVSQASRNACRSLTATGNPEGSWWPSMPELDDAALAVLLEALTDRKTRRWLVGRLRPRLAGRPHPIVRLARRRRPGLLPIRNHTHRGAERH